MPFLAQANWLIGLLNRLYVACCRTGSMLYNLEPNWSTSFDGTVSVPGNRRKVEKDFVVRSITHDHAIAAITIEPEDTALSDG